MSFNNSSEITHLGLSSRRQEQIFTWLSRAKGTLGGKVSPLNGVNINRKIAGGLARGVADKKIADKYLLSENLHQVPGAANNIYLGLLIANGEFVAVKEPHVLFEAALEAEGVILDYLARSPSRRIVECVEMRAQPQVLVENFIFGVNIKTLQEQAVLTAAEIAAVMIWSIDTLSTMHRTGVIYNDSPFNNLQIDAYGNSVLIDFNVSELSADPGLRRRDVGMAHHSFAGFLKSLPLPDNNLSRLIKAGEIGPGSAVARPGDALYPNCREFMAAILTAIAADGEILEN